MLLQAQFRGSIFMGLYVRKFNYMYYGPLTKNIIALLQQN